MVGSSPINVVMLVRKDRELKGKDVSEPSMLTFETAKMPLVVFLATVVYVVVFAFTNYFIATSIMLVAFMLVAFMLVEKVKVKWVALVTVVYLAFIYYLFVVQLSVRLIR